ncbi:unnamed protein product [Lactuca saligna]|uniref:Helitron helicase-like domain-containing protein n=1 Tax=Lactuca saligna TaxID=75948 RepID=A0AA35Y755_LACSI|nr:unnamed protein product [Lactuca saligna]
MRSVGVLLKYLDCGDYNCICEFCGSYFWFDERSLKLSTAHHPRYSHCCKSGVVILPYPSRLPTEFISLFDNVRFLRDIRAYNSMFFMTWFGENVDEDPNDSHGPYVFNVSEKRDLDEGIVTFLVAFLKDNNEYVCTFKTAKQLADEMNLASYVVCLFNNVPDHRYDLPSPGSLGCIVIGDDNNCRNYDIVVHSNSGRLQRISKLHPNNMMLQYPILFPYGEKGRSPRLKLDLYTIEFQKRGLIHCHTLIWVNSAYRIKNPDDVDTYITVELPYPMMEPRLYETITTCTIHGSCGPLNEKALCMKDGKCSKHFPKSFLDSTFFDTEGYVRYKRGSSARHTTPRRVVIDNGYDVPYNKRLCSRFQAHINVEYCGWNMMIKHLFKYISKGVDRVKYVIQKSEPNDKTG